MKLSVAAVRSTLSQLGWWRHCHRPMATYDEAYVVMAAPQGVRVLWWDGFNLSPPAPTLVRELRAYGYAVDREGLVTIPAESDPQARAWRVKYSRVSPRRMGSTGYAHRFQPSLGLGPELP